MQKDISIVIPIHDDANTIGKTIDNILHFFDREGLAGEIVIVNDGGRENGVQAVKEKMKDADRIKLADRKENRGKGFSVREGIKLSIGKIIFYTDADLPYGTEYIKQMYKKLNNGECDFILANRSLAGDGGMRKATFIRKLTHMIYAVFVGALIIKFSDTQAGLKGMTKITAEAIVPYLTIDKFAFDVELILLAKKNGFRIQEMPVILQKSGKSNLSIIFDSPQMIKDVLKIVWRNRLGFYNIKSKKAKE